VLLAAAMNVGEQVAETLRAGSAVAGRELTAAQLEPAVAAAIVELDGGAVRFRHPLVRSAIRQAAGAEEERRLHEAFADVYADDPDRRVWHRTALVDGEHEDLARDLEAVAARARERGAAPIALSALERAVALSAPPERTRRVLSASQHAFELGRPDVVLALLDQVPLRDATPVERARATWIAEMVDSRPLGDPARSEALIAEAEDAGRAGDRALQLDLLWLVAWRAWWVDPGPRTREALVGAARRLGDLRTADPRVVAISVYADPFGDAPVVIERARQLSRHRRPDPDASRHFGAATVVMGTFDLAARLLGAAADSLRADGRVGHLPRMLVLQGHVASRMADWSVAVPAVEECLRLAVELDDPLWIAGGQSVAAMTAALRGDEAGTAEAAEAAERISLPAGANVTTAMAQSARAASALGAGRHAEAFGLAASLFDPASPAYHPIAGCWLVGDLAEAGLHAGEIDRARELVARVEAMVGDTPGIGSIGLRHAHALLADDDRAEEAFQRALGADLQGWPFQRARILIAHGQWLRRRRRTAESRAPLREARDLFDALGCLAWGDQARRELRAAGERSRKRTPAAREQLTAHELQVAQLAAEGLSNREIAQHLFVSHRTISTHLSRIYPKLGVRGRGELAAVLGRSPAP
jgi:DNA-binding CsgD family transcriptional regulator